MNFTQSELESIDRQIAAREIDLRELRMRRRQLINHLTKQTLISPEMAAIYEKAKKTREVLAL
jgi:hypothetical protein